MTIDHNLITSLLSGQDSPVRTLIDQMPGGFLVYRADGQEEIIYANAALQQLFGCRSLDEFRAWTGNSFHGVVHPDDLEAVEESIRQQIADSQYDLDYVEYRIIPKHGDIRWIEDYGHFIHDEAGDLFYVFLGDATEKKRKHEQAIHLLKQEQLHRLQIIEGLSVDYDSILYCDMATDSLKPYRTSCRIEKHFSPHETHYSYNELVYRYLQSWVCAEDRALFALAASPDYIRKKLSRDKTFLINYRVFGQQKHEYLQLRIVNVGPEKPVSQIVLGCRSVDAELTRRIEQRQILESALKQAKEAISVKNIFLANMSHDIRTPMNAIAGFTALAKNHLENPDKLLGCLEHIETANGQLLRLINDVLEISRMESGKIHIEETPCSLTALLKSVHLSLFAQAAAKNLSLSLALDDLVHDSVFADPPKLLQILLQLGDNAVKYTESGGHIVISVHEQSTPGQEFAVYQFIVEDDGIGIDKDFLAHIFEPFERQGNTTLSGVYGTGLGLPIIKGLVTMMEGQIEIDSTPGQGSRFIVTLHLRPSSKERAPEVVSEPAPVLPSARPRLLLVEDNEINLEIEVELLEDAGFQIDTAKNGRLAVDMLQAAAPGTYALVLMDIQMPVMDGYQAAQAIRRLPDPDLASIPIVALSANAFEEDRKASMASGMNAHLAKPMDIGQILNTIGKFTQAPE
ncbi:MAG: response regulator [Lachnospiraceae bacterium]|nr:response regulator [Lachnospiraceae bacterium]